MNETEGTLNVADTLTPSDADGALNVENMGRTLAAVWSSLAYIPDLLPDANTGSTTDWARFCRALVFVARSEDDPAQRTITKAAKAAGIARGSISASMSRHASRRFTVEDVLAGVQPPWVGERDEIFKFILDASLTAIERMDPETLEREVSALAAGNPPSQEWLDAVFPPDLVSWLLTENEEAPA